MASIPGLQYQENTKVVKNTVKAHLHSTLGTIGDKLTDTKVVVGALTEYTATVDMFKLNQGIISPEQKKEYAVLKAILKTGASAGLNYQKYLASKATGTEMELTSKEQKSIDDMSLTSLETRDAKEAVKIQKVLGQDVDYDAIEAAYEKRTVGDITIANNLKLANGDIMGDPEAVDAVLIEFTKDLDISNATFSELNGAHQMQYTDQEGKPQVKTFNGFEEAYILEADKNSAEDAKNGSILNGFYNLVEPITTAVTGATALHLAPSMVVGEAIGDAGAVVGDMAGRSWDAIADVFEKGVTGIEEYLIGLDDSKKPKDKELP
jgi:hypothetical protein